MNENQFQKKQPRPMENNVFQKTPKRADNFMDTNDSTLWSEFKNGSDSAFAAIYEKYVGRMYSYGMKLVQNPELVKDETQELFIEIWNSKARLGDVKSIQSYLFKSIRRKLLRKVSKQRKKRADHLVDETFIAEMVEDTLYLPEKQLLEERRLRLRKVLGNLNPKQREIIYLKYYAKLSYEEIKEVMALDKKATYNLMGRAINELRKRMDTISILIFYWFC